MTTNRFEALEKQTQILEDVASTFSHESPQYAAIKNAAFALIFAMSEQYEAFIRFVDLSREELTNEQKEHLRKMGLSV